MYVITYSAYYQASEQLDCMCYAVCKTRKQVESILQQLFMNEERDGYIRESRYGEYSGQYSFVRDTYGGRDQHMITVESRQFLYERG